MSRAGGLQTFEMQMREKLVYEGYMQMNPKYKSPFYTEHIKRIDEEN